MMVCSRLVLVLLAVACTNAIMFEVRQGIRKCIADEFRHDVLISGQFEISDKLARNPSFPNEIITRSFQMEFVVCFLSLILVLVCLFVDLVLFLD